MSNSNFRRRRRAGPAATAVLIALAVAGTTWVRAEVKPAERNDDLELARRLENAFVKVAEQASKSVVIITAKHKSSPKPGAAGGDDGSGESEGSPFEFFFKHHGIPVPRDIESEGSGIILRSDGYILTNNHVVDNYDEIRVRLQDGREFPATRVGNDDRTDVAVIKIEAKDLPAARLANSDEVRVGQWAIAIGAPFQLEYSFTVGFISAKGRSTVWRRDGSAYEDYLQTDASINPGNSGGPLCDIEGRVVGINTLIEGLNRGIGFAIPINMAREVADQLIAKGKIVRPWLGIGIEPLAANKELRDLNKDVKDGVVVKAIYPETPAAASDLRPADIIVSVDGSPVGTPRELQLQVLRKQVGQNVTLGVLRDNKPIKVVLKTGELPDQAQMASRQTPGRSPKVESGFGLTVQALTREVAEHLHLADSSGVVITDVADGSIAQEKGLQPGDVITEVDRAAIASIEDFQKALAHADKTKGALLYVKRAGASTFVVLKETK